MSKQEIIGNIYFFIKQGLVPKTLLWRMQERKTNLLLWNMLKIFLEQSVEIKMNPRGYNSFVVPHNNHRYQVDIFFISKKIKGKTKIQSWISLYWLFE